MELLCLLDPARQHQQHRRQRPRLEIEKVGKRAARAECVEIKQGYLHDEHARRGNHRHRAGAQAVERGIHIDILAERLQNARNYKYNDDGGGDYTQPADKVEKVEQLIQNKPEKEKLAFVGDGINDAPVLRRADIGIAMGAMGSDAAIEAADVVLMDDDPLQISKAIKISRKCLGIVYQNIVVAIGVKLACLVLVALGFANMWLAVFADVGVMIIAVLNAIRALFVKNL